ncbi:hypothetical protein IE53DRAFT_183275 [Violaceomyces palustris]|uniref:Uncharacterized protein n=1 Tax=Violaceomyces palustris TaxID=1673888 RepID=A0ACD0NSE3_9BASI|nr:hypothetical protein IE53DRAFT_183275 [Violaceomyces palustris]
MDGRWRWAESSHHTYSDSPFPFLPLPSRVLHSTPLKVMMTITIMNDCLLEIPANRSINTSSIFTIVSLSSTVALFVSNTHPRRSKNLQARVGNSLLRDTSIEMGSKPPQSAVVCTLLPLCQGPASPLSALDLALHSPLSHRYPPSPPVVATLTQTPSSSVPPLPSLFSLSIAIHSKLPDTYVHTHPPHTVVSVCNKDTRTLHPSYSLPFSFSFSFFFPFRL